MSTTFKSAAESYLRDKGLARGTRNEYTSTIRKWERWGGGGPIEEIRRKDIREFLDRVHEEAIKDEATNPGRTANKAREHLRAVLSWAWEQELLILRLVGPFLSGFRPMATTRSAPELEDRRRPAVARVNEGYSQTEVARSLGVNVRSVRTWIASYRDKGDAGLAASTAPGQAPKLTPQQGQLVLGWLAKNATESGFATEQWTAPRVAQLIEKTFGVKYHPRYLNEWLISRGITPRKPRRVPRERDQVEIDRWVAEELPRIKKSRRGAGPPRPDRRERLPDGPAGPPHPGPARPDPGDQAEVHLSR